jgi:hypothetical protein
MTSNAIAANISNMASSFILNHFAGNTSKFYALKNNRGFNN